MGRRRSAAAVALALIALPIAAVLVAAGARRSESGTLELRVVLASPLPGDLTALEVRPAWAGANRSERRDQDWSRVTLVRQLVTLLPEDAGAVPRRPVVIADGPLPAGDYVRVFVASPDIIGITEDGRRERLTSHIEPIVRQFTVSSGDRVTIDLVWTVMPPTTLHGGAPEAFVRDAQFAPAPLPALDQEEETP